MTNYHTWSTGTGNFTNQGNAYDLSAGDTTTSANGASGTTQATSYKNQIYQNTTNLVGLQTCTLNVYRTYTQPLGTDSHGGVVINYSWDGTTWTNLSDLIGGTAKSAATPVETFSLTIPSSSTNLNTLRVQFYTYSRVNYNDYLNTYTYGSTGHAIYDISVDVTSGPVISVGTITPTGTQQQGSALTLSCTATNETSNVTWSQVSGPTTGSFSGASFNTGTGAASVTWSAPTGSSASGSYVLRCTSNTDPTKYSNVTITIPTISVTINSNNYGYANILARGTNRTFTASVTGHTNTAVTWTCSGGSIGSSSGVLTASSTPGIYTVTATHTVDTSKTNTQSVFVDYAKPTTFSVATSGSGDDLSYGHEFAYDLDQNNAANLSALAWQYYNGSMENDVTVEIWYSGFPSYAYNSATVYLKCKRGLAFPGITYKVGAGGTPTYLGHFPATLSTVSFTLPASQNTNNLYISANLYATAIFDYDLVLQQWVFSTSSDCTGDLYELWIEPNSTYVAALDHVAPGTGAGKKVYPSNLYNTGTGVLATPTTSTTAVYLLDGTNGYWFITNA